MPNPAANGYPESNIERTLGRLEGRLDAVSDSVEQILAAMKEDRAARRAVEELQTARFVQIEKQIDALRADMDTVKPLASKWTRWQYISFGMFLTVSGLWGFALTVINHLPAGLGTFLGGGRP